MEEKQKIMENLQQEMRRGTIVLCVLLNTGTETYGYSLVRTLQDSGIEIEQNTLYPLMRRLEKQGFLESIWNTEESRPRKYYKRTPEGTRVTEKLILEWDRMALIVDEMKNKENDHENS